MNLEPGALAIIVNHPYDYLNGVICRLLEFASPIETNPFTNGIELNIWKVEFTHGEYKDDSGHVVPWGYLPAKYLIPINGDQVIDEKVLEQCQ